MEGRIGFSRAAAIAIVATLVLVSRAAASVQYGHYHASLGSGAEKQHADLFVSPMSVRITYVVLAHCTDQTSPLIGDFSGINMKPRPNGKFSFRRTLSESLTRITGQLNGYTAKVRIHITDTVSGAICNGTTTFNARYTGP